MHYILEEVIYFFWCSAFFLGKIQKKFKKKAPKNA